RPARRGRPAHRKRRRRHAPLPGRLSQRLQGGEQARAAHAPLVFPTGTAFLAQNRFTCEPKAACKFHYYQSVSPTPFCRVIVSGCPILISPHFGEIGWGF